MYFFWGVLWMKIDVIGDIHGCYDELCELFTRLGYRYDGLSYTHPDDRIPVFLGDITDRGPASLAVIEFVYQLVIKEKRAKYVPGNHCNKLYRYFLGNRVKVQHGLETTVAEFAALNPHQQDVIKNKFMTLYDKAPLYLQLPALHAVVAHAGIKEEFIGRYDKQVESFVLYGDVTGEKDEIGRPIRKDWAQHYTGEQWIIYGHTPVLRPRIVHKTINIDTGCVFGNQLTAFSLPEETITSVPSHQPLKLDRFSFMNEIT